MIYKRNEAAKTLPQPPQQSRENAALATFSQPGCSQVATPGGAALWFRDMILSLAGFSVLYPGFDETSFDL